VGKAFAYGWASGAGILGGFDCRAIGLVWLSVGKTGLGSGRGQGLRPDCRGGLEGIGKGFDSLAGIEQRRVGRLPGPR